MRNTGFGPAGDFRASEDNTLRHEASFSQLEKQKFSSLEKINKKNKGNIHQFIQKQSLQASMNNHSNTAIQLSKIYTNPLSTAQQKQQQQSHSRSCLQFNSQGSASSANPGQMPSSKSPITGKTDALGQKFNNFGGTQKQSRGQAQQLKGLH
jgi:hypothetical protein